MNLVLKSEGHLILNDKHIYYSRFTRLDAAKRWASECAKTWVATHPAVRGFLLVRPVDAGRLEKAGGTIIPYWRD